ncbi:chemotaxis protein CheA [Bacteriovorax sp. PP10]|uniref:Chemotaxis protein CheA n=1 Tax=Bacteriovorax antarcticus TaxID=3088717 RepID=A0ABU5VXV9_9BACT|nr:chemotaxis protein CheA [Bacteriovorax sp. PP10]MEA9357792.1 chemotaxis protein CheA [Bacteriovorax sp. PP10]
MDDFEKEVKLDFLTEALQLLDDSEQAFLALESDKHNADLMNQIFRLAHNLKGTSRAVGFGDVAEFTHEFENLILQLKEGKLEITDAIVSLLLECNDHVSVMIKMLNMDLNSRFDSKEIIEKILSALAGKLVVAAKPQATETHEEVVDEETFSSEEISAEDIALLQSFEDNLNAPAEVLSMEQKEKRAESFFPSEKPAMAAAPVVAPIEGVVVQDQKKAAAVKGNNEDDSIRVSLARVEMLNNVVGELVIIQTVLNQHREEIENPLMLKSLSQLAKLSKEIQNISMSLRMVPLKQTLQKMQRIVRDTSKALDKKVVLELVGEETEIDKTVLEHLADPLVHIVRNAVDHGLESTEGRLAAGKDEAGVVTIKAFHEGNNLVIEISDDGKGINAKVIREKAIEKGVISANATMSEEEIVNLIFHPGFSTKSEVSEISGRGVGMDVVKTNIEKLSGEVKVITEIGKGSKFKVVLPLTLAIIEAMITKIGDERYIIPLGQVYESLSPTADIVHHVNGVGDCLKIRGEVIPLFKISKALQRNLNEKPLHEQIAIIVNTNERSFAVLVDDILHQQQVVIKKLGEEIKNQKGFMGSSILGDGRPAFILDLIELFAGSMKKKKSTFIDDMAA